MVKFVTVLGTDIERSIRDAIAETLGEMRYEMWFGDTGKVEILGPVVRVYAINKFAADWSNKNYLSMIVGACRAFLDEGRRIEIVSQEQLDTETNHDKDNEILVRNFAGDSIIVRNDGPCEKEVILSIPTSQGKTKRRNSGVSPVDIGVFHADDKHVSTSIPPKQLQLNQRNCAKPAKNTCKRLTPQELNGQTIVQGKEKPVNMFSRQSQQPVVTQASSTQRADCDMVTPQNVAVGSRRPKTRLFDGLEDIVAQAEKKTGARSKKSKPVSENRITASAPELKRDAENRNVVVVSEGIGSRANTNSSSAASRRQAWRQFVVGPSNQLAVRAAELAINHIGKVSPIYIFGPTSVGKTHLLETIRAGLRRDRQAKPPIMMTAEQFTSSYIDGLKQGIPLFRNKFNGISALLIDDIQFFKGKDSTQTEFLRTFELLKGQGVQIVLTGDQPIHGLAELLKPEIVSRIEAGMPCEIKSAEHETLLAIFKQMATSRNLKFSDDICDCVVSHLATHARQLSGAINRLHAAMLTTHRPITLESVENILEDMIRNNRRNIRLQDIDKAVCETLQLSGQLLQSKSRMKQATQPRMLAMWLARKHTRSALSEIGRYFGDRSHSTVVSAQKKVDQWLHETPDFGLTDSAPPIAEVIQKIERLLQTR